MTDIVYIGSDTVLVSFYNTQMLFSLFNMKNWNICKNSFSYSVIFFTIKPFKTEKNFRIKNVNNGYQVDLEFSHSDPDFIATAVKIRNDGVNLKHTSIKFKFLKNRDFQVD